MFKLVVLSALLALVAGKPGVHLVPITAYAAPAVHSVPSAVSHSSRTDVVSNPLVATTYTATAPVVDAAIAAPVVHTAHIAPIAHHTAYAVPAVVSHAAYAPAIIGYAGHFGYANPGQYGYAF